MSTIYSADEIINKTLYTQAGRTVNIRKLPTIDSEIIATIGGGQIVGVVYSYVSRPDGLWWMIERNNSKFWVKHLIGYFDVKALAGQGALTTEEILKRKEEAEKSLGEKAIDKIISVIKPVVFLIAGAFIINSFINKK